MGNTASSEPNERIPRTMSGNEVRVGDHLTMARRFTRSFYRIDRAHPECMYAGETWEVSTVYKFGDLVVIRPGEPVCRAVLDRGECRNCHLNRLMATGTGDAMALLDSLCDPSVGSVTRIQWYSKPIAHNARPMHFQIASSLGVTHSFLKVTCQGGAKNNVFCLEKADGGSMTNGVLLSYWKDVFADSRFAAEVLSLRIDRNTWNINQLFHSMVAMGPYDLSTTNCHHAAYHLCNRFLDKRLDRNPLENQCIAAASLGAMGMTGENLGINSQASQSIAGGSQASSTNHDFGQGRIGRQHQKVLHPADWCVSSQQFQQLLEFVQQEYKDEDPCTATVVEEVIKPMTCDSGLSFALHSNLSGLRIKYFVTHSWRLSFKQLAINIMRVIRARGPGNIWICFLANPQNWSYEELDRLLGEQVWQSPFALALKEAEFLIVVRAAGLNIYERLWCVLERALADHCGVRCLFVGPVPDDVQPSRMGYYGQATDPRDASKILDFLRHIYCHMEASRIVSHVNEICLNVVTEPENFESWTATAMLPFQFLSPNAHSTGHPLGAYMRTVNTQQRRVYPSWFLVAKQKS